MKRYIILLMMLSAVTLYAQTDRQHIRLGNKQYRKRNYDKAEVEYSKALEKNKRNSQALYNMGCVMLQKEGSERDDSVVISRFLAAAKEEKDKKGKLIRQERYSGAMQRSFFVGKAVTEEDIKAKFEDGVLKLDIPKKEAPKVPEKKTIMIEG